MAIIDFSTFSLYRWRYIIGYSLVGLTLAALLTFAGLFLPGGLSDFEQSAVIATNSLSFTDLTTIGRLNLPFYLLQLGSLELFGASDFSIKLPALVLALFSALGLIFLLRRWFSHNIAVIGSLIAITTGQFLFVAQSGYSGILYIFWPIMLLLLGTLITRTKRRFLWKILFFITAALSLYTPLSIYPLIAIVLAIVLHPHLRNIVRNLSRTKLIVSIASGVVILIPLIYGIIRDPSLALRLLGVPSSGEVNISENVVTLLKQYLDFWNPSTTTLMTPVFGLGSLMLIAFGLYRLIRTRETTQSYLIISWLICLVPVLIINPLYTTVMFLPLVLLLTSGLQGVISYWYRLFPKNPYARVAGLIPLVVLVGALVVSGLDRYAYGYYYQPGTATNFNRDLSLLPKGEQTLVVSQEELPFYKAIESYRKGLTVTTAPETSNFIATRQAYVDSGKFAGRADTSQVNQIITSGASKDADRFYLYGTVEKTQ